MEIIGIVIKFLWSCHFVFYFVIVNLFSIFVVWIDGRIGSEVSQKAAYCKVRLLRLSTL